MEELKQDSLKSLTITDYSSATPKKQPEPIGLQWLEVNLDGIEFYNDEHLYTQGDSLVNQFYCGNWSASVQEMKDNYIRWDDLLTYIENHEVWEDYLGKGEHFDHSFWGELGFALGRDK